MSELKQKFDSAAKRVHELKQKPDNNALLKLYGLYKQATSGNIRGDRPGLFDPKGRAKYDAWKSQLNKTPQKAMEEYVAYVNSLFANQR